MTIRYSHLYEYVKLYTISKHFEIISGQQIPVLESRFCPHTRPRAKIKIRKACFYLYAMHIKCLKSEIMINRDIGEIHRTIVKDRFLF